MSQDFEVKMNLYDINKSVIAQLQETVSIKQFCKKVEQLKKIKQNNYYFIFNKEISYFTLFSNKETKDKNDGCFGEIIISCFQSIFGEDFTLVSAEFDDNSQLEIWVKDSQNIPYVFYLVAYDMGVVPIGE